MLVKNALKLPSIESLEVYGEIVGEILQRKIKNAHISLTNMKNSK